MVRRNTLVASLLATALIVPLGAASAKEQKGPGPDWMSLEQATQKLTAAGYTFVTALKADDGRWEGKAVKDGRIVEVKVDPRNGTIAEDTDD